MNLPQDVLAANDAEQSMLSFKPCSNRNCRKKAYRVTPKKEGLDFYLCEDGHVNGREIATGFGQNNGKS